MLALSALVPTVAQSQAPGVLGPTFTKQFFPDTIGPGSTTELVYTIDNATGTPVADLAFTHVLPAGLVLATPASPTTECGGALTAPDGGSTISFSGGGLGPGSTCTIRVDATGSTLGVFTSTTGDLTSSAGNSGTATDDLVIAASRPGFSKSFSPTAVQLGARSTLTFTVDASAIGSNTFNGTFTDFLPPGLVVADPSNASISCVGSFSPAPGATTVSAFSMFLPPGTVCTLAVDVQAESAGTLNNRTGTLSSSAGDSGFAVAALDVNVDRLSFTKDFIDDPAAPGETTTLRFSITYFGRTEPATAITFTDDLNATLSGLQAAGPLPAEPCGPGSTLSGTSLLTLTGGNLGPNENCTFDVSLLVPAGALPGAYPNVTSSISGDVDGTTETGSPATSSLIVAPVPSLSKRFLDTNTLLPVGSALAGGDVVLEFTLTNGSGDFPATGISFTDSLAGFLPGTTASALPTDPCGAGSSVSQTTLPDPSGPALLLNNGNLPADGSCTFQVTLDIPLDAPLNTYTNTTSGATATVDGQTYTGLPATADLSILAPPGFGKAFANGVEPGGTVDLEFTLELSENAPTDATGIAFTDDLDAALTGLTAISLPAAGFCGPGAQMTGISLLSVTGASLAPGDSCTFSVPVQVPAGAVPGDYPNTTSQLTATIDGVAVTGPAVTGDLRVLGLQAFKEFTDDPAVAGGTVTLEFTLDNTASPLAASAISFSDDLGEVLPGLTALGLPATDVCGAGSQLLLIGDTVFVTGASLAAGATCTFGVTLAIPAGTDSGVYTNTTAAPTATIDGSPEVIPPASDELTVIDPLEITKEFTDDPVEPGQTVTLEFTLTNASPSDAATALTFTDDLDAALSGLAAVGLPANDVCGAGSQISGSSVLTLTGGNLAPSSSCAFSVTLQVPAGASAGTTVVNTTSQLSGSVGGAAATAPPASDVLQIDLVELTKSFAGPSTATGTVVLNFEITNRSIAPIGSLAFTDDLDAALSGLSAITLPASPCGAGSSISGSSLLTFTGGSLGAGASCSFAVTLEVPPGAAAGAYPNITSELFSAGVATGSPAADTLVIEPPPTFAKAFADAQMPVGDVTTLTFSIDNSASALAASSLAFTDPIPAGLQVAAAPAALNNCGGSLTAIPNSTVISLSGGSVGAGAVCTISVDITATVAGTLVNTTGDLTSSSGNSGTAGDSILIDPPPPPLFDKGFADSQIPLGDTTTLTFAIDNTAALVPATALAFVDNLPAGIAVADPSSVVNNCGGTLSAPPASTSITLSGGSVAAGSTCSITVDVEAVQAGTFTNTTGDLTSSSGNSGTASAGIVIDPPPPPTFTKAFADPQIPLGDTTTLTFTIDNAAALVDADDLAFVDNLPAGIEVADPANVVNGCSGTLSTAPGATSISFSAGSVAAGAACSISVDVAAVQDGTFTNTTGDLTSTSGNSGTASAGIVIDPPPPPTFAKIFADPQIPLGDSTTLTFTIDNAAALVDADDLAFVDNLPAGLEVAAPPNAVNGCGGTLSATAGSASIALSGGSVATGAACSISVDVAAVQDGTFTNTTGDLTSTSGNSGTASAGIVIDPPPPPAFVKAFAPDDINTGEVSTLTFAIDNTGALVPADDLAFIDNLPAGMEVASPANAINGCGGTLSATAASTTITLSGGSVAASSDCSISVDVATTTAGTKVNTTSDLTSTSGNSGVATATLIAREAPGFTKAFAPDTITLGGTSTLTFTIDNAGKTVTAGDLDFTDPLPAGMTVADPANAATTCGGGTLTASPGSQTVSYTGGSVAAGAACTVSVDVVGNVIGALQNVSGALTSTLGDSGTASATLDVTEDSDGVPAAIEDLAPNNGDGNNDGIPDGTQDDVASLPTFDDRGFMTVEIISGCGELNNVAADSPGNQGASLPNRQFPFGLVGFELPCESAVVDVIFHGGGSGIAQGYFKFGPTTPGDPASSAWYEFSSSGGATGAVYAGGDVWTLTLADNDLGDATGDDGRIVDPGGPAVRAVPVPVVNGPWLVLLALAMMIALVVATPGRIRVRERR